MYTLDLLISKACNQDCYYCNVYKNTKFKDKTPEVDIDFLKYALSCFDFNLNVIIGGGEPGIVSNLDEVYRTLKDTKKVKNIRLLSNGQVRLNDYDWLKDVDYFEHLIKDIKGTNLIKFYDLDIFPNHKHWKQVIVTTENVVNSLLDNYEFFEDLGIFNDSFWFKTMNAKTHSAINFKENLIKFYDKIGKTNELYGIIEEDDKKRRCCAKYPYMSSIDFEDKKFLHCNAHSIICERKELSKENVDLNLKGKLFNYNDYCSKCYVYNNNLVETIFRRTNVKR